MNRSKNLKLLELGCGNGRDSIYFISKGIKVTAIDASDIAIKRLQSLDLVNATFICGNFVDSSLIYSQKYDCCYSRFSLHAISESQENLLLKNVRKSLNKYGKFFIEVRSIHDELYGKGKRVEGKHSFIYDGHFRRFIDKIELEEKLLQNGFKIEYSEESREFAPFGDSNPPVIRVIVS